MSIRIETGPYPGAPYGTWMSWKISDAALADTRRLAEEAAELMDLLSHLDNGRDGNGPWTRQVMDALIKVAQSKSRIDLALAGADPAPRASGTASQSARGSSMDVHIVWYEAQTFYND